MSASLVSTVVGKYPRGEEKLLFFGTFFHENTELAVDLIQIKEPALITQIRVIPLGAQVNLSAGSFQLGATNPSEFVVEFYYNDLQVPSKSTFELLKNFEFNDKSQIQLICDSPDEIITDGLLVRGKYSTATLAVYGHPVDKVPIKEAVAETRKESPPPAVSDVEIAVLVTTIPDPPLESPEKEAGASYVVAQVVEREADVLNSLETQELSPAAQSIPTITTRVNYDSVQTSLEEEEGQLEELVQDTTEIEMEECVPKDSTKVGPIILPEVMDTEEISDGEVFPSDDEEELMVEPDKRDSKSLGSTEGKVFIDPLLDEVEPISSPPQDQLSDVDDSLLDEFQEPGFEEIISDEEIDFPEYDYGEWEENWAHKFTKTFNPFSDSFQVYPHKNIKFDYGIPVPNSKTKEGCLDLLLRKAEKYSVDRFNVNVQESWVEDLEMLIPVIPFALSSLPTNSKDRELCESALWFWVDLGSNLNSAIQQSSLPFKTRHLKVGIKLIQCLAYIEGYIADKLLKFRLPSQEANGSFHTTSVQQRLLNLLMEPHMSNVNKLLILRTLDATMSTKMGFEEFTSAPSSDEQSCYQKLLDFSLKPEFSTRMAFSFKSLHKKVILMEGLAGLDNFIRNVTSDIQDQTDNESFDQHLRTLEDLVSTATHIDQYFSHPLRILPANSVVELPPVNSTGHDPKLSFVRMLRQTKFLQLVSVLVNSKEVAGRVVGPIAELLSILINWEVGIVYLCSENEPITILLKSLLQQDDDLSGIACLVSHCTEVMKCIDVLSSESFKTDSEEERDEDIHNLQTIVSFLMTPVGREALLKILSKGNYIVPLLRCLNPSESDQRFGQLSRHEKSARKGYVVELLEFVVRSCDCIEFLEKHGSTIFNIISSFTEFNEGCEKLINVQAFLKPANNHTIFTLDGLETLCDLIKSKKTDLLRSCRTAENNWGYPAEMTTAFRILCELATGWEDNDITKNLVMGSDEMLVRQLKYELALVKIHSLDMISTMTGILQTIVDEFVQPIIHSHIFVSSRGDALIALILPLIKILRKTISQVIQARKAEFRDTSAVAVLLKIYSLLEYFPNNALSYSKAQEVGQHIIGILLSYTVPAVKQGSETEEELNKSTWTAVVLEIVRFTLEEPANFQVGLTIFSEMLPLPLPMPSAIGLSETICSEAVKLRRLWSAYIHGLSSQLQEMIGILCGSSNARLLNLLKRVCVQLADLSASTCLVICRALLDALLQSFEVENDTTDLLVPSSQGNSVKAWVDTATKTADTQCSPHTTRLLGFLASLISNCSPVKCGILHILKGSTKIDEKYCDIITCLCSILLINPAIYAGATSTTHIQAQDNVVTIFQALCDVEISMLIPMFGKQEKTFEAEFLLANSLPQREHLIAISSSLVIYLGSIGNYELKIPPVQVLEGALRTLEIIAETEYGFYHLRRSMEKHPGTLSKVAASFMLNDIGNSDIFESLLPSLMSFLDFLKSVTTSRPQPMGSFPPRHSVLGPNELRRHFDSTAIRGLNYSTTVIKPDVKTEKTATSSELEQEDQNESSMDVETTLSKQEPEDKPSLPPLVQLQTVFEKHFTQLQNCQTSFNNIEPSDLDTAIQIITNVLQTLQGTPSQETESEASHEVMLPVSESLVELFTMRPTFVTVDRIGNETIPVFWLTAVPPAFELDTENAESELVPCDLEELSRTYLGGFDVSKEIQSLSKTFDLQSSSVKEEAKSDSKYRSGDGYMRAPQSNMQLHRRSQYMNSMRGGSNRGMYNRGLSGQGRNMYDPFRSRPPNTSRPPSLHVDDFVALESSGPSQMRPGGQDNFSNRGRSGQRGGLNSMPYSHDRRRTPGPVSRPGQPGGGGYYQLKRHDSPSMSQTRNIRGGRIFSTPNSDRWTADSRGNSAPAYDRNNRSGNYDDKYRTASTGPMRNSTSSPRNHNQPYPPRIGYRDARPSTSNNSSPRWRDKQNNKPFNR